MKQLTYTALIKGVFLSAACNTALAASNDYSPASFAAKTILHSNSKAARWDFAYPVGNGSMGGISQGLFPVEQIYINNDTIWTRPKYHPLKKDDRKAGMDKVFNLCLQGKYAEAGKVYAKTKNRSNTVATFQGLAALEIKYHSKEKQLNTERELDLISGVTTNRFKFKSSTITETMFASYPKQCIALKVTTTSAEGLNFSLKLKRKAGITLLKAEKNCLILEGNSGRNATAFKLAIAVKTDTPDAVTTSGNTLEVKNAKFAEIIIVSTTNYNRSAPREPLKQWREKTDDILQKALKSGWENLQKEAVADHASLMNRCRLQLGETPEKITSLPTPARLKRIKKRGRDSDLIRIFFQLGRHLLISSSRPGSLPPNLQGLWEPGLNAAWNGDFHLNINIQMNMWPANITGLSECNEPIFALQKILLKHGKATAASLGCRGYAAGLNTDAWGHADWSGGSLDWDSFMLGGHWLQEHLMDYYRYTGDKAFLQKTAWPILKNGALFILDWLHTDPETGLLICGPGSSPENVFTYKNANGKTIRANISIGNSFDQYIAWETLTDTLEVAEILEIKDPITADIAEKLKKLAFPKIGEDGRLMEWRKPFAEPWKAHRHKSHLIGLFPGHLYSLSQTPEYAEAARKSLEVRMNPKGKDARGGGFTGWNLAWTANLWARLHDGNKALQTIYWQLSTQCNENLFNRCNRPFQIDGNLGTVSAVAQMLIQSYERDQKERVILRLLPALPDDWKNGKAAGLHAQGGVKVNMKWNNGKISDAEIYATRDIEFILNYNDKKETVKLKKGEIYRIQ